MTCAGPWGPHHRLRIALLLAMAAALPALAAPPPAPPHRAKTKVQAETKTPAKAQAKRSKTPAPAAKPTARAERPARAAPAPAALPMRPAAGAEARLIEVYRLFGRGQSVEALAKARKLVADQPNFQLAQLVYGDLLAARLPPARRPSQMRPDADPQALSELADESRRRLQALRERPPPGTVPSAFVELAPSIRHAIAVDTSRSRLYLLENGPQGLQLKADYYISVGKSGIGKQAEGDARTPLGIYHVTSNLDPKTLREFYGIGALPINYPNPYDVRRGRTGSGIWLHGTPRAQYARAPLSTDGCVVLANNDLQELIRRAQIGATPVVVAQNLQWTVPAQLQGDKQAFDKTLAQWLDARAQGDAARLQKFHALDFRRIGNKKAMDSAQGIAEDIRVANGQHLLLKDVSYLRWNGEDNAMVSSFGEVASGQRTGRQRRQYWIRQGTEWRILQEEVSGS
ncbi:L,D-transpeptidase family protein [Variovorax sp. LT1R16]|uniref:L,D-transpeptidase family protein n=1 Tax=Variovorax sp. LT1R16 TaxID=3443728 RepID=UPI003F45A906